MDGHYNYLYIFVKYNHAQLTIGHWSIVHDYI